MKIDRDLLGNATQTVVANVDWLAVTVRFGEPPDWSRTKDPPKHRLRVLGSTKVWRDRVILVTDYGDKVATILSSPRNSKMFESECGLIEVANEWLYHGYGWEYIFEVLQQVAPFEILGISRADLCADFNPDEQQQDIIKGLSVKRYYIEGKQNGAGFWSISSGEKYRNKLAPWTLNEQINHQQSWGHKTSNIKWKLYYKTRELIEVEDKPYIRDQWQRSGLDITNVWRLESSVMYPRMLLMNNEPVTYEVFCKQWPALLRSLYQTRFTVRKNEGHKDKSNDKIVHFVRPLETINDDLRCRPAVTTKQRYGRVTLLRRLLKSMTDDAVLLNDTAREGCLWLIDSIVKEDELENYFISATGLTIGDYIEQSRVNAFGRDATLQVGVE